MLHHIRRAASRIGQTIFWILRTGLWDDANNWIDTSIWDDGVDGVIETGIWMDTGIWVDDYIWKDS